MDDGVIPLSWRSGDGPSTEEDAFLCLHEVRFGICLKRERERELKENKTHGVGCSMRSLCSVRDGVDATIAWTGIV